MIENIQRDDLRAPEIAAFVAGRLDAGDTQAEISRKLGKPRDWVSRFASVQSMPEFLRARLESSSIRALYELYQAWRTHPAAIERLCAARESFTDAQARELVREVRADFDRTDAQSEPPAGSVPSEGVTSRRERRCGVRQARARMQATDDLPAKPRVASPSRSARLTILVRHQHRTGRLLIDRSASQGSRHGVVVFDGSHEAEEVAASALTIEEILPP